MNRINTVPAESEYAFDNFDFSQVKIGKQYLPFVNYSYCESEKTWLPYLWNEVNVVWKSKASDYTQTIIIEHNGEYSAFYFNFNEGFKPLSEGGETIKDVFAEEQIECICPNKFADETNYTGKHYVEFCYQ